MIRNYFKTAWRNLTKNKMYALVNIGGLAIGITVCLLIGVWLQRELSFDNFHPNSKNIFRLANTFKSQSESFSQAPSGFAFGVDLPKRITGIRATCRVLAFEHKFKVGARQFFEPQTLIADSNFFSFFGFKLEEGQPGQVLNMPNGIVLSHDAAIKYFGTTSNTIGKVMTMDDESVIVAGIAENAPVNSNLYYDIIVPYDNFRRKALTQWKEDLDQEWVGGWPYVYLQLSDEGQRKEIEGKFNTLAQRMEEKDWKENNMSYQYFLQPIRDIHLKSNLRYDSPNNGNLATVNIFSIVGVIVLLLACINYINLTTAGAVKRAKETSIRKVVGATRPQLLRQFFLETFIVCAVSIVLGLGLLKAVLPFFSGWIGQPYYFPFTFTTISMIVAFVLIISIIAGIYPAGILSSFQPAVSLKGNLLQGIHGNVIRKTLVVFQFTVTIALIACILVISQQMNYVKSKSLGFNGNAVAEVVFNGDDHVSQHYASIRNELLKSPYILNVSEHFQNVVGGLGNGWTTTENSKGEEVSTSIYRLNVDADYFDTYNMQLAAGRFFTKNSSDTVKAVLVNEAAVKTFGWGSAENAIGKRFGKGEEARYVIGVVKDFNFESLHKRVDALLIGYVGTANHLSIKMDRAHFREAVNKLSQTWSHIMPDVPLQFFFIDEQINAQYGNEQKMEGIFYGFSALSLLIACLGLFGLSTFVVERRVKEIGVRKVLGASISGIVGLLSKDFLKLVFVSILIASPLAWYFMNSWLNNFAYRINIHIWVFLAAGIIAILIALITVSIQSIKAAVANPVKSLRTE